MKFCNRFLGFIYFFKNCHCLYEFYEVQFDLKIFLCLQKIRLYKSSNCVPFERIVNCPWKIIHLVRQSWVSKQNYTLSERIRLQTKKEKKTKKKKHSIYVSITNLVINDKHDSLVFVLKRLKSQMILVNGMKSKHSQQMHKTPFNNC